MQNPLIAVSGKFWQRGWRRLVGLAAGTALALSTSGCTLTLAPLAKHTAAFSTATGVVSDGSKEAYLAANQLHEDAEFAAAIDSYGSPGWRPDMPLKPLLTPEQLAARIKVLDALKAYAAALDGLTETKKRDKKLDDASASAGSNLASLVAKGAPDLATVFPGTTAASGASTAIAGLGELLINGRAKKALAATTADMDPNIQALCGLIESDASALATEADLDYKGPIQNLDEFLLHNPAIDPAAKRALVARMLTLAQKEKLNDKMLAKLAESVSALGKAHKALADAAAGKDPETIKQRLQELISLGTELGTYYGSLQASAASGS